MQPRHVIRRSAIARLVLAGMAIAVLQLAASGAFASSAATGHARFHALFALGVLVVAGAILVRWPAAGLASRAPALGLVVLAAAQLLESFGAYGFGADNETRQNDMVILHDVGLAATALGLVAAVSGIALGVGVGSRRLRGSRRWVGTGAAVVAFGGGLLAVKTLIGF
jgi:hypothetical protein